MKLLVIDDEEIVAQIIAEVVTQRGWQAISRPNADGIIDLIRREKIELLLIDYFMPGRDGLQVVESLRQEGLHLPVILFSGNPGGIDKACAGRLGIQSILAKPLSVHQLQVVLDEVKAGVPRNPEYFPDVWNSPLM